MTNLTIPQHGWPDEYVQRYRQAGHWQGETFGALLRSRAEQHPDRIAVVGGSKNLTYAQLDEHASAIAAGLLAQGFQAGDRIVVHLPNIPEFITVVFGLFRAGIIPLYALPAHRITEIEHFAKSGGATGYLCAAEHGGFNYLGLATTLQERCPDVEHVIVIGDATDRYTSLQDIEAAGANTDVLATASSAQDIAFLQISGGSTGLSKLIPRTHDDYIYTLRESARICELDGDSVLLCALPMAHNFPMSSPGFLGTLYAGGRVVLSLSPSPEACFELIKREKVTQCSLVPPLLMLWLDAAERSKPNLSSLRVIQVGGAKLIPEVAQRVRPTLGVTLQQVFGMAEGLVNYTRLGDDAETIIETQGRPISPDDELLIVDDDGQAVADGQAGHLLTRGPYTIRGYYNNPAANQRSFTEDGYYRTGDIVKLTPDGYLVVQGRAGDHINRAGEKISAEEIENHLLANPAVFDAAVVSVPDTYLGERSCAFIIPRNEKPRAVELKKWMRERGIADFKVPDQIIFVDTFSETAVGKISRKTLRAQLRAQLDTTQQNS
ncbi:(2,3-dihydroxybenzoyl)adenylate synthase [Pollutimonas harenae]|uniref:(2,3-dihydroxybenzoyl)adenylate synthase n=1 Tax=Pollutimonas harenae TaxID=657015 RepID=A0A853H2B0_9BURK|nr:(2,3-dihydroxybenzoyl)adenylate synthase [Pollutimonas harenae]NYT86160.1 (2,3-dihydroxybenzoyl)adenylate synthase [Pollutimonas harenae]TEA71197.1 (2,3-dihydroxybenzoyl)adenylate synthase [Pollutimonas harenae]